MKNKYYRSLTKFIILLSIVFLSPYAASAATITVTNTNDSGAGSLRQAVLDAVDGVDDIDFDPSLFGQTITLDSEITIDKSITIMGPGRDVITIDGSGTGTHRIFTINDGTATVKVVTIDGLTLINGDAGGGSGGAIVNREDLTVNNCTIDSNTADSGGGIFNSPSTSILTLTNSTVSNNTTTNGDGGGIFNSGTATITNSTISGNAASIDGGGIHNAGTLTITNSTITDNAANGIVPSPSAIPTPGRGGGINGPVTIENSIVAGNTAVSSDPNCSGTITDNGGNLADDASCGTFTNNSAVFTDLGPLQNNGGPTNTHALLAGNPAIDFDGNCGINDQRNFPRDVTCDSGAYEAQPTGTIKIKKLSVPTGGTGFQFNVTSTPPDVFFPASFILDDTQMTANVIVPLGDYTVVETIPTNFVVTNIDCGNATNVVPTSTDLPNGKVVLPIDANADAVECVYTNTELFTLTVTKSGAGTGTATAPVGTPDNGGVSCGGDCSETYSNGTVVTVGGTPDPGSELGVISGDCDAAGNVTMDGNKTCDVMFDLSPKLTVVTGGTGTGNVTAPAGVPAAGGINCGTGGADCMEVYPKGTVVALTATPAADSVLNGFGTDCNFAGTVTMTANKTCNVVFSLAPSPTPTPTPSPSPTGSPTPTPSPTPTASPTPTPSPSPGFEVCTTNADCTSDEKCVIGSGLSIGVCVLKTGGGNGNCALAAPGAPTTTSIANILATLIPAFLFGIWMVARRTRRRDEDI